MTPETLADIAGMTRSEPWVIRAKFDAGARKALQLAAKLKQPAGGMDAEIDAPAAFDSIDDIFGRVGDLRDRVHRATRKTA